MIWNDFSINRGFKCYSFWVALSFLRNGRGVTFHLYNTIDTCLRLKLITISSDYYFGLRVFTVQSRFSICHNLVYFLIKIWVWKKARFRRVDEKKELIRLLLLVPEFWLWKYKKWSSFQVEWITTTLLKLKCSSFKPYSCAWPGLGTQPRQEASSDLWVDVLILQWLTSRGKTASWKNGLVAAK